MQHSETLKELATALAKAQGQIEALKTSETAQVRSDKGSYTYKYATLADVLEASRKPLSDNGLSIIQTPEGGPEQITVTTRLLHSSGEWLESSITLRPSPATPQGIGSAITYARRYSAMAVLGIAPEDDDGASASQPPARTVQQPARQAPVAVPKPAPQLDQVAEDCKRISLNITRMLSDGLITVDDVKTYGQLESIRDAVDNRDVKGLNAAYILLQEYISIKQKEQAEAS